MPDINYFFRISNICQSIYHRLTAWTCMLLWSSLSVRMGGCIFHKNHSSKDMCHCIIVIQIRKAIFKSLIKYCIQKPEVFPNLFYYFLPYKGIDSKKCYLELLQLNNKHFLRIAQNIDIYSSHTSDCPISFTNKVFNPRISQDIIF